MLQCLSSLFPSSSLQSGLILTSTKNTPKPSLCPNITMEQKMCVPKTSEEKSPECLRNQAKPFVVAIGGIIRIARVMSHALWW